MASDPRSPKTRVDRDGVRVTTTTSQSRSVWAVLVLLIAVVIVAFVLMRSRPESPTPQLSAQTTRANAHDTAPVPPAAGKPAVRLTHREAPDMQPKEAQRGSTAESAEVPAAAAGTGDEPSGIALFPPMGTKPIKRGIIVPDDFQLPPGYVRHYQTTDDGEQLPAILMFHPDFEFVDEHGKTIDIPKDRVVPPDLAPPGMRIQMLPVPEAQGPPDK
jgi:hypothetical protein